MKTYLSIVGVALVSACMGSMAAEMATQTTREQRMDDALQGYRSTHPDKNAGPVARTEESIKHGARRAGHEIKHGAERAGHAIGRVGDKIEDEIEAPRKTAP